MESQTAFSNLNPITDPSMVQDPFARDAQVSISANSKHPRGIVEILNSINQIGYRQPEPIAQITPSAATVDSSEKKPQTNQNVLGTANHTKMALSEQLSGNAQADSRSINHSSKSMQSDIEIHQVLSEAELELYRLQKPLPMPAVYEVAPDFFDLHSLDDRLDWVAKQAEQLAAVIAIPASPIHSIEVPTPWLADDDKRESAERPDDDEANHHLFWVSTHGQVIEIDGRDGFDYIDLACFDLSQASFEGDFIKLHFPDNGTFQVKYRNIAYAIFADNQRVDLADEIADCDLQNG